MKRLIYAPKVYIFIRSSNMGGNVYDVSADVTSGSVTQNLGDLSKAKWTLRNRYRKWIRDHETGKQIFLPMDMVTIWLQRVAGRPIQVFTGYLDAVPYYQAYPGDAMFEASCTLKKLAFTWFDPGLPFFQQWVMSSDGWTITPDGEAYNPAYLTQAEALGPDQSLQSSNRTTATINDTGFDALLGRFLTEVAGWANDDVLISNLPKDLPKLAARLYADVNKSSQKDLKALESALGQVMGLDGWANPSSDTQQTNSGPAQTPAVIQLLAKIKKRCDLSYIPLLACAFAGLATTNLDPSFELQGDNPRTNDSTWLYGLYALPANGQAPPGGPRSPAGEPTIDGTPVSQIVGDAELATDIFAKRMNRYPSLVKAVNQTPSMANVQALVEKALGRSLNTYIDLDTQKVFNQAKSYCASAIVSTPPGSQPADSTDPAQLTWKDPKVQKLLSAQEKQVVTRYYQGSHPWLAGILWRAKQVSQQIQITKPLGKSGVSVIALTGPAQALSLFYGALNGDPSVDSVDAIIDGREYKLHNGVLSNTDTTTTNNNTVTVTQVSKPSQQTASSSQQSQQNLGDLGVKLGQFSANAAFAAQFAFPANQIQSISLTGDRALMNDVSCLDGVKQFCQASLRTFRALPDGRFLAFYPDYFGAQRKPYWQIYNIEITNFGIQLNDEALATHVYVVGDTFDGDGQISWEDQVSTRGVATITQAFMLNSFIEPYHDTNPKDPLQSPPLGRLQDAYSFLQHYGARPYEEDQPLIRNVFYEFLLAWQRFMQKWSAQFATECTFTFQPEVMAGGLISFPDHDVQMFCESVTHTWDYTSGFETQATLTSPSLTPNKRGKDHRLYPGFALGGNINTVGT